MQEEIKFLMESVQMAEKSQDFKPLILANKVHLHLGESLENKYEIIPLKNLNSFLKPHEILEELMLNNWNSATIFQELFNEFGQLSEDEIFDCLMVLVNSYSLSEDPIQRIAYNVFISAKNSINNKFN